MDHRRAELPEGYDQQRVVMESVLLNGAIPVEQGVVSGKRIVVKFDRSLIIEYLESFAEEVAFYLKGKSPVKPCSAVRIWCG